jgi:hypothetical protein
MSWSKLCHFIHSRFGIGDGSYVGSTSLGSTGASFIVGVSNTDGINKTGIVGTGFYVGNFATIIGFFVGCFVGNLRQIGVFDGFCPMTKQKDETKRKRRGFSLEN